MIIVNGNEESYIGIIPQNDLVEIRIPRGKQELFFNNDNQIIKKLINVDGKIKEPIYVEFEEIKIEKLKLQGDEQNSDY